MPPAKLLASIRAAVGAVAAWAAVELYAFLDVPLYIALAWFTLALAVAVGWYARVAAGLLAGLGLFLVLGPAYKNHLYLLVLCLALLAVSDCERYHAVRPRAGAPGGAQLFLLRFQLSAVYLFAGVAKLNPSFLSGEALEVQFRHAVWGLPDLSPFAAPLAVAVVALEFALGAGVWLPRLRPLAMGVALPLHVGMLLVPDRALDVAGVAVFGVLMMTLLAAFVDVRERTVLYDADCSFCRRWVALFRRLDAFGALRFEPAPALDAMQLLAPDGRVHAGYDAFAGIVAVLPAGYLVAPYLRLPGVRHLGHRAYRRVAASRTCDPVQPAEAVIARP